MELILTGINWPAVVVGAIVAFIAGWVWYGPLFGKKWAVGAKVQMGEAKDMPWQAMLAQAVSTFLLAWTIGVTEVTNNLPLALLIAFTIAVMMKAKGFFLQHNKYAITVDSVYVLVMVVLMIAVHAVL